MAVLSPGGTISQQTPTQAPTPTPTLSSTLASPSTSASVSTSTFASSLPSLSVSAFVSESITTRVTLARALRSAVYVHPSLYISTPQDSTTDADADADADTDTHTGTRACASAHAGIGTGRSTESRPAIGAEPGPGRSYRCTTRLAAGLDVLHDAPAVYALYHAFRKEVCVSCFGGYDRGTGLKFASGSVRACCRACLDAWSRSESESESVSESDACTGLKSGSGLDCDGSVSDGDELHGDSGRNELLPGQDTRDGEGGREDRGRREVAAAKTRREVQRAWDAVTGMKGGMKRTVGQGIDLLRFCASGLVLYFTDRVLWASILELQDDRDRITELEMGEVPAVVDALMVCVAQIKEHGVTRAEVLELVMQLIGRSRCNCFGIWEQRDETGSRYGSGKETDETLSIDSKVHNLNDERTVDESTTTGSFPDAEMFGYAIYPASSFFNHSCAPSVKKVRRGRYMHFILLRDVDAGEELTISYLGDREYDGTAGRRKILKDWWGFDCTCSRCGPLVAKPDTS